MKIIFWFIGGFILFTIAAYIYIAYQNYVVKKYLENYYQEFEFLFKIMGGKEKTLKDITTLINKFKFRKYDDVIESFYNHLLEKKKKKELYTVITLYDISLKIYLQSIGKLNSKTEYNQYQKYLLEMKTI